MIHRATHRLGTIRPDACLAIPITVLVLALSSCAPAAGPDRMDALVPDGDLCPPLVLDAGPTGAQSYSLRFDEDVEAVEGSFALEPPDALLTASSRGSWLDIAFSAPQRPGTDYAVAGEAADRHGNRTRFVFQFPGWNDRQPELRISELQTAKNSSSLHPHRDFVELLAMTEGNLGGVELEWCSSVKTCVYRFAGVEVACGERIVLHLAPEGLAGERDETGEDLAVSEGVDSSPTGRDFWSAAGGLPDQSGVLLLRWRPGVQPVDGLFYSADDKSGPLPEDRIAAALQTMMHAGIWNCASGGTTWEEGFRWHASVARSLDRREGGGCGPDSWYLSASGAQSPGLPNDPAP